MRGVPDDCRISPLVVTDIEALSALVREIWYQHYPDIITVKQIEYMLEQAAHSQGCDQVYLQVNRNNFDSIAEYRRLGFEVMDGVKTDIGGGFFMDDYVMAKDVRGEA